MPANDNVMDGLVFETASHLSLSAQQAEALRNWPVIAQHVSRRADRMTTDKITINGVRFHPANKDAILFALATVHYRNRQDKLASYEVKFLPDAATLMVVFRVAGNQATKPSHHVLMAEQTRYAMDGSVQSIPGGLLKQGELDIKAVWEKPAAGALREFLEESVSPEHRGIFPAIKPDVIHPLKIKGGNHTGGAHPSIDQLLYGFYAEIDLQQNRFRALQKAINGSTAGIHAETETTTVKIVPLRRAYLDYLRTGQDGTACGLQLARYMYNKGLMKLVV